jgi:hypothetical protein
MALNSGMIFPVVNEIELFIMGNKTQQGSMACLLLTIIAGSCCIIPLFFMCCSWWRKIVYAVYEIRN